MMNFSHASRPLSLLVCILILSCAAERKQRPIIVTGLGVNLEQARKDAIRNAIQSQVGSFVLSDLTERNDVITEDTISEYSGALIDKMDVLESRQRADGSWIFKAKFAVLEDAKRQHNRVPLAKSGLIAGQNLAGFAVSLTEKRRQAAATWEKVLNRMPLRAFRYDVMSVGLMGQQTVHDNHVTLDFIVTPHWRLDFVKALRQALEQGAQQVPADFAMSYGNIHWLNNLPNADQTGICLADGFQTSGLGSHVDCFIVDVDTDQIKQWLCFSRLNLTFQAQGNVGASQLIFTERSRGLVFPFIDVDRNNGGSMTFIFQVIDDAELQEITDYPAISGATLWTSEVPLSTLSGLKSVKAWVGCHA